MDRFDVPIVDTSDMDTLEKSYWLGVQHEYICDHAYRGRFITNILDSEEEKEKIINEYDGYNVSFESAYDCYGNRIEDLIAVIIV